MNEPYETFVIPECCCGNHQPDGSCCPGWLHMDGSDGRPSPHVERCDDCAKYKHDGTAQAAHRRECRDLRCPYVIRRRSVRPTRLRMGQSVIVARGVCVVAYRGKDGTLVLEIDGADALRDENQHGPVLRVYLNDGLIFDNPVNS
jgi:hypothetical protein